MRRTITEKYDENGRVVERTIVDDGGAPAVVGWVTYTEPVTYFKLGCAACALSGICNCVIPPGGVQITCSVA